MIISTRALGFPQGSPPDKGGTCKWQPPSVQKEKCAQPTTEAQRWAHAEADGSWLRNWPSMFWGLKLTPFLGSNAASVDDGDWLLCTIYIYIYILVRLMLSTLVIKYVFFNANLVRSNQRATKYQQTTNKNDVPSEISSSLSSFYDVFFPVTLLYKHDCSRISTAKPFTASSKCGAKSCSW